MPRVIKCPKCSKTYRLGSAVPPSFSCKACGQLMNLSRFAAAGDEPASRPAVQPSKKKSSTVGAFVAGIVLLGVMGLRVWRYFAPKPEVDSTAANYVIDQYLRPNETFDQRMSRLAAGREREDMAINSKRLTVTSPADQELVAGDSVRVAGVLTAGSPTERVYVEEQLVRTGLGPFEATVSLKPDQKYVHVHLRYGYADDYTRTIEIKRK